MDSTRAEREINNVGDCGDGYRRTFLRSQVGIGSESDCLFGESNRILYISDSDAGLKVEKTGGVDGGEGVCGDSRRNAG